MASENKTTTEVTEDADMSECDGENVVTMMDVLQDQVDFEEDANAVLGASDDNNCTYSKGYIKRQAIYACLTCCPEAKSDPRKRAGVCLACSLMCHESHELVELYTKRNFRCDCGNPKFNSHPCTFTPDKADLNEENYYNQNFSGLYCICQRPYPDPETTEEDVMIQCIVCEDWLHGSHLDATVPNNEQYSEMICKTCMEKNAFLHDYSELAVNIENVDVDVVNGVDNNSKLTNGDAKTESNNSLNESVSKTDVEMTDEKLEANASATETSSESKDGNPPLDSKSGSDIEEKTSSQDANKEESMETNQHETSDATSEESPESGEQKQSIGESEQKAVTDSEIKDGANDVNEEPVVNKTENNCDKVTEENISDESENRADEEQTKEEIDHPQEKPSEDNAEKIEEDRLLADPEDDPKNTDSVEKNVDATEQATTSDETNNLSNDAKITNNDSNVTSDTVAHEKEEPKLDDSADSGVDEKLNTSDEKVNSEEAPSKSEEQNANDVATNAKHTSTNNDVNTDDSSENKIESESIPENKNTPECDTAQSSAEKVSEKRKHVDENSDNIDAKKQKLDYKVCIRPKGVKKVYKGATFWPSNFRQALCTCQECLSMYKDLSVLFLIDPEDTVSAYENLGKQKVSGKPTQYERGMQALSSLDRIQQINALTEYNKMRDKLLDFLKSFKDKKEIVKEEDIKAFFAGMKPKRKPDGVYFCR